MIIAYLLRSTKATTKEQFCDVIDNPTDWNYAFNLPVLIVTYGQHSASQPSFFPKTIVNSVDGDQPRWNAPFRCYWCQDNGHFEPYNDIINGILQKSYQLWKRHGGSSTVITPPLTRYIDDTPQIYKIDYQTNEKTSYTRVISKLVLSK
jgi:hypothetical protein